MKQRMVGLLVVVGLLLGGVSILSAQQGKVVVPDSTVEHPEDVGRRAHTNHLILAKGSPAPAASAPWGLSPAMIRSAYKLPASGGGGGVIAIVDAYDYPTAKDDFDTFSREFGLPLSDDKQCNGANPCFQLVYAGGKQPRADCGWAQEAALDIEWAHAMAPYAQIILVEADSNSFSDLLAAVDKATQLVTSGGLPAGNRTTGEVSMSWGGSEFRSETSFDSHFTGSSGVVYFASSGDSGGKTIYPSVSPYIVAAGGTTLNMDGTTFLSETGWSGSGGGRSRYESRPIYQDGIVAIVGRARGVPDFSFDADPNTGVSVYDSTSCQGYVGWLVFGGTSVSSPSLAGIVNAAGHFYDDSATELSTIYNTYSTTYGSDYRDITSGKAARYNCATGWDFVTGVGSDLGLAGK